jgi:zinc transport system ATP-binding protein
VNSVEFDRVSFGYEGAPIFDRVSFSVPAGEFLVVIGPNGGGKSTLLRLMLGLLFPSEGRIDVLGKPPGRTSEVGYVPQDVEKGLSMPVTVRRVVSMGRLGARSGGNDSVDRAMEAMDLVPLSDRPVGSLSQGQRQRTLIARALASEPKLLLLDEPLASVDPDARKSIFDSLHDVAEGRTVVGVSHDYSIIPACASAVACVDRSIYYHDGGELTEELFFKASCSCPVEIIGHGLPHRVLEEHRHG